MTCPSIVGCEPVLETVSAWVASFEDDNVSGRPEWSSRQRACPYIAQDPTEDLSLYRDPSGPNPTCGAWDPSSQATV
jgi:hypothetical protein